MLREESALTVSASFPAGDPVHVRQVRSWLGAVLIERWGEDDGFAGELAASEVLTNASVHGGGTIRVAAVIGCDELVADVFDESPKPPKPRQAGDDDVTGRGLQIIDNLGGQLATLPSEGGKIVRLRFARKRPAPMDLLAAWGDDDA